MVSASQETMTLLHLPIIRIRMQRVLHGWRRVMVQGKRQRFVDDSLSLKVRHEYDDSPFRTLVSHSLDPQRLNCQNIALPDEFVSQTTRVHPESFNKDYLGTDNSLDVFNKRLPQRRVGVRVRSGESTSIRRFEGMIPAKHNNTPAGSRGQDFDHPRQPRAKLYGGLKGQSYLEQYLIKTSGK